jgi:CRISPR-associated protein (TIGR03984 family)
MSRTLLTKIGQAQVVSVGPDFVGNEAHWLAGYAQQYNLRWLLAHADDGVIWGEVRANSLALSNITFDHVSSQTRVSPDLRAQTLQQLRLFGAAGELLLWRVENGFAARWLMDVDSVEPDCMEENYLLWGNRSEADRDGFFLLTEGKQGLRHAPPLKPETKGDHRELKRLSFTVRHYLAYDEDGQAFIHMSRLVSLNNNGASLTEARFNLG